MFQNFYLFLKLSKRNVHVSKLEEKNHNQLYEIQARKEPVLFSDLIGEHSFDIQVPNLMSTGSNFWPQSNLNIFQILLKHKTLPRSLEPKSRERCPYNSKSD